MVLGDNVRYLMLEGLEKATAAVAALDEPLRRRMYLFIRAAEKPVTRDEAAAHVGISRKLAAFHLERLVDAGMLVAGSPRPGVGEVRGRGRIPKVYEPSGLEIDVSIPERRYELAGELLAAAIDRRRPGEPSADAALRVARERGAEMGRKAQTKVRGRRRTDLARAVVAELERSGFEPARASDGSVILRNCPFKDLARFSPELMCSMNQALIDGMVRGVGHPALDAELDPDPGRCCVRVRESERAPS